MLKSYRSIALELTCRSFSLTFEKGTHYKGNDVVDLHSEVHVGKDQNRSEADPIIMMHGVFGNRRNFSAIAKKVVQLCGLEVRE